jgi:RimJ/RimL family protein N-acetyltransferase
MLDALTPADIAEVMRIERLPGYSAFIGAWTAEAHADEMASPDARYLGWRAGRGLAGFAIFQRFTQPVVRLRRIAVEGPGGGTGTHLLRGAVDWLFETNPARAIDLHVRAENQRARHVYSREGFVVGGGDDRGEEGMVLTREAWTALPRRA